MAKTAEAVRTLLMQVWSPALEAARADEAALTAMLADDGIPGPLEPWDWRYYAEKRRRELHAIDDADVKPYFPLDGMINGPSPAQTVYLASISHLSLPTT